MNQVTVIYGSVLTKLYSAFNQTYQFVDITSDNGLAHANSFRST